MNVKANVFFTLIILSIFSCSNDDDSVSVSKRAQAILGQWEYVSIASDRAVDLNGDNIYSLDLFDTQELPQCLKDNITTYTENGPSDKPEYIITENNLACNDNSPFSIVEEDFRELSENNYVINFEKRSPFRIIDLTKNHLIVETDDFLEGLEYVTTITYNKK